jgi:hypothetical protein
VLATALFASHAGAVADEPKPKPENIISVHLTEPVAPKIRARPEILGQRCQPDRSGNPQPMLVLKSKAGSFWTGSRQLVRVARGVSEWQTCWRRTPIPQT